MATEDESLVFVDPDPDLDVLIHHLKVLLPSRFVGTWAQGLRDINLEADNWAGVSSRGNSVYKLTFPCWGISCDLGALVIVLSRLRELDSIYLEGNPMLRGSLLSISSLVFLSTLSLSRTAVTGSLVALTKLIHLRSIFLDRTAIDGRLDDLAPLKELRVLSLCNTRVKGSIDNVTHWLELKWLMLSHCSIKGER